MPPKFTAATGSGTHYHSALIHGPRGVISVPLAVSTIAAADIDAYGYLRPGYPVADDGALFGPVSAGQKVEGVIIEPVKVAASNAPADIAAAPNIDVAISTGGEVNRAIAEANMGRAYNADELAGFLLANSLLRLVH